MMQSLLVIDDHDGHRSYMEVILRRAGYNVIGACDGSQASEILDSNDVDAIVTDLVMPNRDGLATIGRARTSNPDLKILAVTGACRDDGMYLDAAVRMGADLTLAKPFTPAALVSCIRTLLQETQGGTAAMNKIA
jgi:DNA-binding response OmpR family regulator